MMASKLPTLICFSSMGTPYGFGGFNTCYAGVEGYGEGWPDEEGRKIAQRMSACGFKEALPWVDGPPGALFPLDHPDDRCDISCKKESYVERIRNFVSAAHDMGIKVHLYFAVGPVAITRADEKGRPIVHTHTLAVNHPDKFTVTRDGQTSVERVMRGGVRTGFAGLGYPEIRSELAEYYVDMVDRTGADGIQLEPVSMPMDPKGVSIYGYERPIVEAYREATGLNPVEIPNSREDWVKFRCHFTTLLAKEVRKGLSSLDQDVVLSTVGYTWEDDRHHFWPWEEWVKEGLMEAFYFRTKPHPSLIPSMQRAQTLCGEVGMPFIPCFDLKTQDDRDLDTDLLVACLVTLMDAGMGRIGIYGLRFAPLAHNPLEVDVGLWQEILGRLGTQKDLK